VPLTAKYPTTCEVCSLPINPGEEIAKVGQRWAHAGCAPGGGGSATAGAARSASVKAAGAAGAARPAARSKPRPADMAAAEGALEVWTDGACSGNPGPGGWAWATEDGRLASGGAPSTTNQRMEIMAALEAVRTLGGPLVVVSDSTYVVNCFRDGWWRGWLERDWVNSQKKPVANRDLWEPLVEAVLANGKTSFRWVKGHSGDPMNDLVDRLAVEAAKAAAAAR